MTTTEWQFGGWIQGISPTLGWSLLGTALALGLIITFVCYRRTLRELPRGPRWLLSGLRATFCAGLILCLANPSRVERTRLDEPPKKPLAVVVDRSESMTNKDNRGHSRLEAAVKAWEKIRPDAERQFSNIQFSSFAKDVTAAKQLQEAVNQPHPGEETRMFQSLDQVLDAAPANGFGGVLCITDGLDTTSGSPSNLVSRAVNTKTPLYFLPGENRFRSHEYVQIHEVKLPMQALQKTQFAYRTVIDVFSERDQDLPITLKRGDLPIATAVLKVKKGANVLSWQKMIDAPAPGPMVLELRVGAEPKPKLARNVVHVTEKLTVNILYYQGALDWGYHFLNKIFQRDPSFTVTALFNPELGTKTHAAGEKEMRNSVGLPNNPQQLAKYQLVVLDNVFVDQLSKLQQQALIDYAHEGGGLLFILPNENAAAAFAGSKLEEMLPVVFEPPGAATEQHDVKELFQRMVQSSGASGGMEDADETNHSLIPFTFPERSRLSDLFNGHGKDGTGKIVPMFSEYVPVRRAKPAAEVLAYHPNIKNPRTGEKRILLATQTFGDGRSSVLATDSLWRWRLSLPSDSTEAATFWQQLLLWLARSSSMEGIRFLETSTEAPLDQPLAATIQGIGELAPEVRAIGPDQKEAKLELQQKENSQWQISWTPHIEGMWKISAKTAGTIEAARFINIIPNGGGARDRADLPVNFELMSELAAETGGEVLQTQAPDSWAQASETQPLEFIKHRDLLWNHWWILALCLGPYASELLLRRRWKLL